jgi:hypothetical protein
VNRLYLLLTQISRSTSLRLDFSLPESYTRITSATGDVLANFSRLSIFVSYVNFFFTFVEFFSTKISTKTDLHSHSAKCQNIVTLEDERGALGSWHNSNRLQWLGFGLPVRP